MLCKTMQLSVLAVLAIHLAGVGMLLEAQQPPAKAQPNGKIPTLFIVGDSTVKNGQKGMVGWGEVIGKHFDKSKIKVDNHAIAGRSSANRGLCRRNPGKSRLHPRWA